MKTYLGTSAPAKWYLNEQESECFAAWMAEQDDTHISTLTVTEFRCLLARRERTKELGEVSQRHGKPATARRALLQTGNHLVVLRQT